MRAAIEEYTYSKSCPEFSDELEGRLEKNGWSIDEADKTKVVTYWDYVAGDWEDDRESYEHRYYFDLKDADGGCRVEATYNKKGDAVNGSMVSSRKHNKELELIAWQSPETAEQIRANYEATYKAELEKLQDKEGEDADEPSDQDSQKSAETSVDKAGAGS